MSREDLRQALDGPKGSLDMYLECRNEADVRADILALLGDKKREHFAALAMQGYCANSGETHQSLATHQIAELAVTQADALIAELSK
jgi:hypothetical protein